VATGKRLSSVGSGSFGTTDSDGAGSVGNRTDGSGGTNGTGREFPGRGVGVPDGGRGVAGTVPGVRRPGRGEPVTVGPDGDTVSRGACTGGNSSWGRRGGMSA